MAYRDISVSIGANPETDIAGLRIGDPTGILRILFEAREPALTILGLGGAADVIRSPVQQARQRLESMDSVRTQETPRGDDCAIDANRLQNIDRKTEVGEAVWAREYASAIGLRADPPRIQTGTFRWTAQQDEIEGVLFTPNGGTANERLSNDHQ